MLFAAAALGFAACEDYPDAFELADGVPTVHYVRYADREVFIEQAYMGELVCLVGENLRSVREMYFNEHPAVLNTSYMTENTLIAQIPNQLSADPTDKVYLITKNKDTVTVDFKVMLPNPIIKSMSCEFKKPGEKVTVYGNYFAEPMTLTFEDGNGVELTSFESVSMTEVTFVIPEGAKPGRIKIETESGLARSPFSYYDYCNGLITDFDGGTDVVPQGWNIAAVTASEGGLDGNYIQMGPTDLTASGDWNEAYKLPFWCGNWNGDPMSITSGAGVPICNIIDFTNWESMGIKFELCIPASNPWSAASMQVVFTSAERCANDSWQNNTYIHTSATDGGLDLCRGLYCPWQESGSFHTNGEWITVTIPFSEFKYNADGTEGKVALSGPEDFASLIIWPWSGGVYGAACQPIFRIDNIRAVPVK